jgi:hypothetical protein
MIYLRSNKDRTLVTTSTTTQKYNQLNLKHFFNQQITTSKTTANSGDRKQHHYFTGLAKRPGIPEKWAGVLPDIHFKLFFS